MDNKSRRNGAGRWTGTGMRVWRARGGRAAGQRGRGGDVQAEGGGGSREHETPDARPRIELLFAAHSLTLVEK